MVKVFRMRAKGKKRPPSSLVVEREFGLSTICSSQDADAEVSITSSLSSRTDLSTTPTSRCLLGKIVDTVKEERSPSIASTEDSDGSVEDPVLSIVVYEPPPVPSLPDSFQIWSKLTSACL